MLLVLDVGMRLIRFALKLVELPYIFLLLPFYRRILRPQLYFLMTKNQKHDGNTAGGSKETKQLKQTHSDDSATITRKKPPKMGKQRQISMPDTNGQSHLASLERTFTGL